mmetsp:Transcript_18156/g.39091  ORF Transcript_18156/g.39091 Transcript_18156/m.39091 type:complete len:152 (-) Transcript_18156:999-1454(-)|eukprot:CAMPEP_0202916388 /NCGR_PEP_ID=MMETSP1392-20130828/68469_1 /ASSEMBLY_ACC=CAM_ASM_000868 /TAXON_ID=225041 /ORGANISM="Chlamydomonas chlamydogama, Strain SAG 11-48b" /LENGTH=151 /DNA_ID=CAMNT_0049608807 /DNA_START=85 /DNA_END=540 /DNA_ORIENTATION=-
MYSPIEDVPSKLPLWKGLLLVYLPGMLIVIALEFIYAPTIAVPLLQAILSDMMRDQYDMQSLAGDVVVWICITALNYHFALPQAQTPAQALSQGALIGLFTVGVLDGDCISLIRTWTWGYAALDVAAGAAVSALSCLGMYGAREWLLRRGA